MITRILPAQRWFTEPTPLDWAVERCPKPQ
jgi:hypothetical protein